MAVLNQYKKINKRTCRQSTVKRRRSSSRVAIGDHRTSLSG